MYTTKAVVWTASGCWGQGVSLKEAIEQARRAGASLSDRATATVAATGTEYVRWDNGAVWKGADPYHVDGTLKSLLKQAERTKGE